MTDGTNQPDEKTLRETLKDTPTDWQSRKQLAHLLYDRGSFVEAADIVWEVDELPSIDVELAFAARILAKARPRKAIRLLSALLEHNHGKAVQNLGLANALLHHGMVLQAARFYGAALEADPSLGNPDLEHFLLWTDDEETLWGDFQNRRPKLGELPWMKRDPQEALELTSKINLHTTPIKLPNLKAAAGEELKNDLYQQKPERGAQPSPPPAVTIPMDRVDPKYRLFDDELGAPGEPELPGLTPKPVAKEPAKPEPAKPELPMPAATKPVLATPNFAAAGSSIKPPAAPVTAAPPPTIPFTPPPPKPAPAAVAPIELPAELELEPDPELESEPIAGGAPIKPYLPPVRTGPPPAMTPAPPITLLTGGRPKPPLPPLKKPGAS